MSSLLLEPKFVVTMTLIGCATALAIARVIDGAAWMGMCSITGAAYGASDKIAAAVTAYAKAAAIQEGRKD